MFHDDGYTMHEPSNCMTQRHVKPDFGNFYFIPDELDEAPSMCQPGVPCIWGSAVNVQERFVYVTQPRENRVLVIDLKDTLNPNQVCTWVSIFRIIPEFRILRLTFHRKSASKC